MKKVISYDTETTGFALHGESKMFSFSTCDPGGNTKICRLDKCKVSKIKNTKYLKKIFETSRFIPVMHNAKFDLTATEKYLQKHIAEDIVFHDTSIQSHLLMNDHPSHRLKELAYELAGIKRDDETLVKAFVKDGSDYSKVPVDRMDAYQKLDAERTILLHLFFYPKIKEDKKVNEIYKEELELVKTTMRMEERGIMLHRNRCKKLIDDLTTKRENALEKIEHLSGRRINPDKTSHIEWLLFEKFEMPILKRTKKTSSPSTDKEALNLLRETNPHPILEEITKFKSFSRGRTILKSYLGLVDENDVIHPDINTNGASTGRESCKNPNLQNVEKTGVLLNRYPVPARQAFRPRPGYVNFHIDYSGIEMRLLVHYCQEPLLVKILNKGGDVHRPGAEILFGDEFKNASKKKQKTLRGAAKNANFAIAYGASALKVGKTLGLDANVALRRFDLYYRTFPKLSFLGRALASEAKQQGYIKTIFGRCLRVPENKNYVATNYLIQGTAAEILKRAQNRVHKYLQQATSGEVGILLPIHDEIIIEYPRKRLKDVDHVLKEIKALMVAFEMFLVPLDVEIEIATYDWEHKKRYTL